MSDIAAVGSGTSIESLLSSFQARRIPRGRLLTLLTAAGASAAAAGLLINVAEQAGEAQPVITSVSSHHQPAGTASVDLAQAHEQHLSNQMAGTSAPDAKARSAAVAEMMHDYSPNAIVNDPLFNGPLQGYAAIAVHKTAEMAAISDVTFKMLSRSVVGDQILAHWEMSGIHSGPYYNLPATGKRIQLTGATVQTRGQDGKILVETLYYDAQRMREQLSGVL